MKDPTHETIIPHHKENVVVQAVGDMIVLASMEALIGITLYVFAFIILNDLKIDALPPFTVNNYPIFRAIAIILIIFAAVHFIYAIAFNWLYNCNWCRILGIVLACFSLPVIPTGTFFGMLFIGDMNKIRHAENPKAIEIPDYDKNEIGKEIKINAAVMAHLPIILYYLYKYLITVQSDIMYPAFRMVEIDAIKIFGFVYGGIFILEVVVGIIFRFYGEKNWEQIILLAFSIFNFLCLAIVLQMYVWLNWTVFDFHGLAKVLGNLVWIIGIIFNPIGIFFAIHFMKLLRQSHVYHSTTLKEILNKRKKKKSD